MSTDRIKRALEYLSIGGTKVINGHVVTRWGQDRYEVGTLNRARCSAAEAILVILT